MHTGNQLHWSTKTARRPLNKYLPSQGKKWFKRDGLQCVFCLKKGHTRAFCPLAPYRPPQQHQLPFVERLLAMPRVKTNNFAGMDLQGFLAHVKAQGEEWNAGNPWEGSSMIFDRLRARLGFWRAIGASDSVISWLGYGVPMQFTKEPAHVVFENHRMTEVEEEYVAKDMAKHVASGCFKVAGAGTVKVAHPIMVVEQKDKLRRCDDCRFVNAYLASPKFKMASLKRDVPNIVSDGDIQITEDLEKAYYKIPLAKTAQPFLSFAWKGLFYLTMVMIFGMCQAPMYFTLICKPLARVFGVLKVPSLAYIDDWLWSVPQSKLQPVRDFIKALFSLVGWSFNEKGQEGTRVEFLGFIVDSMKRMFFAREAQLGVLSSQVKELQLAAGVGRWVPKDLVQRAVGRAISLSLAIPAIRVWCRSLYAQIHEQEGANAVLLSLESVRELEMLLSLIQDANGAPFVDPAHDLDMWVDSGECGWGAHVAGQEVRGHFEAEWVGQSSTARELKGLWLALSQPEVRILVTGRRVRLNMDSMCSIRNLIKGGGPVSGLVHLIKGIWVLCRDMNMSLLPRW